MSLHIRQIRKEKADAINQREILFNPDQANF